MEQCKEIMNENNKPIIIIASSIIFMFLFNFLIFDLGYILSLIYDIIIGFLLYFYFFMNDEEQFGKNAEKISLALISESVIISFKLFDYKATKWFFFTSNEKLNIAPNMLTLLITMFFALSLYFRNHITISNIPKSIIINVFNILFFSSLISVLFSNEYYYIPLIGETSFTSQSLCLFLLVLSWVGMKSINIFIIPLLVLLSLGRVGEVNKAMGIVGIFYLLFAYVSILLQIIDNKEIQKLYKTSFKEFSNDFQFKQTVNGDNNANYVPLIEHKDE